MTNCKSKKYFVCRWRTICRFKNYLQVEEVPTNWERTWSADPRIVCRLRNHLQMKELSADQRITTLVDWRMVCRSKKYLICMLKNYMQIDELQVKEAFDLQTEELNADRRTICRLKNNLLIEQLSAEQRIIPMADRRMLCRSINYLQVDELFACWIIFCRSNFDLQIVLRSADNLMHFFSF